MTIPTINPQLEPVEPVQPVETESYVELYLSADQLALPHVTTAPWTDEQIEALRASNPNFNHMIDLIIVNIQTIVLFRNHCCFLATSAVYAAQLRRLARNNLRMIQFYATDLTTSDQIAPLLNGILRRTRNTFPEMFRDCPALAQDLLRNWPTREREHRSTL